MNNIADPTLGVGSQARAVLAMLDREPDFAAYNHGHYEVEILTRAWYNGRERGVSLVMYRWGYERCLVVTFGENRNSDDIFVDSWMTDVPHINGPTVENFPKEAYQDRKTFRYGQAGEAALYIYALMERTYAGLKPLTKAAPTRFERLNEAV